MRQYDSKLADRIKEKEYYKNVDGMDVLVKPIPDGTYSGEMDPRVFPGFRKMAFLSRFLPKSFFAMKSDPKSLNRLREVFNKVDSVPVVESYVNKQVRYLELSDSYQLKMTIFGQSNLMKPILYYIHGGGFFAGRTEVVEEALKLLSTLTDVVIVSVDYRLAPEHPFPRGHHDTYEGLKWVLENGADFGGDVQNIFIAGDSAGGNLSQFCTNRFLEEGYHNIKGQMLLYPTLNMAKITDEYSEVDLSAFVPYKKQERAISLALGMLEESGPMLKEILGVDDISIPAISPYSKVNIDLPPTLISVGEHDALRYEGIAYAKKLKAHDIDANVHFYLGIPHAYLDQVGVLPQSEDCVREMASFIEKYKK